MEGVEECLAALEAEEQPADQDMDGLFAELIAEDEPDSLYA